MLNVEPPGISTLLLWPLVLLFGSRIKVAFLHTPFHVDYIYLGACVRERSTTPKNQGHERGPNRSPERTICAGLLALGYFLSWTWRGVHDI